MTSSSVWLNMSLILWVAAALKIGHKLVTGTALLTQESSSPCLGPLPTIVNR